MTDPNDTKADLDELTKLTLAALLRLMAATEKPTAHLISQAVKLLSVTGVTDEVKDSIRRSQYQRPQPSNGKKTHTPQIPNFDREDPPTFDD